MKKLCQNIYTRLISIYALAILGVFSIVVVASGQSAKATDEKNRLSRYHTLLSFAQSVEVQMNNVLMIQNMLFTDEDIQEFLYRYKDDSIYSQISNAKRVRSTLTQFVLLCPLIRDIHIYSLQQGVMISSGQDVESIELSSHMVYQKPFQQRGADFYVEKKRWNAVSSIEMNQEWMKSLFHDIQLAFPGAQAAFFHDGTMVSNTEGFIRDEAAEELLESEEQLSVLTHEAETKRFAYSFGNPHFTFVVYYPSDDLSVAAWYVNRLLLISIGMVIFLLVLYAVFVSRTVNGPMYQLTALMEEVQKGNLDIQVNYRRNDQFSYIFSGFQQMLDSLKSYIKINYRQQLELKNSEVKQLQSQINPHFLYNCFYNISRYCKLEDSQTAMVLSQKLAAYYMFITRSKDSEVTLEAEYGHTKAYLDIQQLRFHDRVLVQLEELCPEVLSLMVPKIILQPILENAYKYVFDRIDAGGRLRVSAEFDKDLLWISVADNGDSITDEEIEKQNERIQGSEEKESTGLVNVHRRLQLRNAQDGLALRRSDLGGLEVLLYLHLAP